MVCGLCIVVCTPIYAYICRARGCACVCVRGCACVDVHVGCAYVDVHACACKFVICALLDLDTTLSITLGSFLPNSGPTSALELLHYINKIVSHLSITNVVVLVGVWCFTDFFTIQLKVFPLTTDSRTKIIVTMPLILSINNTPTVAYLKRCLGNSAHYQGQLLTRGLVKISYH